VREDGVDGFVSWETLFMKVRHETDETFQRAKQKAREGDEIKKANAQIPQAFSLGDDRVIYSDRKGFFRSAGGGKWVEDWGDGKTILHWVEKVRTADYVEVYDPSREMRMRLQDGGSLWRKESEPGKWLELPESTGKWDRGRTAFVTKIGYVWRVGDDVWIGKQTSDPKFVSVHRETARTADYVEMYASDRKMYVRFYKDKGIWSLDREKWHTWEGSDGYWLVPGK
jgi:hypothetical protein